MEKLYTSEILAYTAGLFDGEGCVCLRGIGKYPSLSIDIASTNEAIILWLQVTFGGSIYRYDNSGRYNRKPSWKWSIGSQEATDFLRLLLPFLRIKKPQAELGIMFQTLKRGRHENHREPLSEDVAIAQKEMQEMMRELNSRGVSYGRN